MEIYKNKDIETNINERGAELGNINVNFYTEDNGTASIRIKMKKQDGTNVDFTKTDMLPRLDLYAKDGSIFTNEPVDIVLPEQGLIQYKVSDYVIRHEGKMDCKLFLENGEESVHVANFYFTIKDSGITGAVGKEIHVDILEDMVKETLLENVNLFRADVNETVEHLKPYVDSKTEEEFNKLSSAKQVDSEVITARGGNETLNARLNQMNEKVEKLPVESAYEGTDFVELLKSITNVKDMYIRHNQAEKKIMIGLITNKVFNKTYNSVVEYNFVENADGLILLRGIRSGVQDINYNKKININVNGTFVTSGSSNTYTTTIGDSFNFNFSGTGFKFNFTCEVRGGLWVFVNKTTGEKKEVSCYSPQTIVKDIYVFENLPDSDYEIEAVFMGEDPMYKDKSTQPPRGYLVYAENLYTPITRDIEAPIDEVSSKWIVPQNSIPEFAFDANPVGATYGNAWVPQHGSEKSVSLNPKIKIMIDGQIVSSETTAIYNTRQQSKIKRFEIIQQFDANNPRGTDGTMWEHTIHHVIDKEQKGLQITNKMKFIQDTEIATGYIGMLPSMISNMNYLMLNNGVKDVSLTPKEDKVFNVDVSSGMYFGNYNSNTYHSIAITPNSLKSITNLFTDKQAKNIGLITYRADGITKIYFKFCENATFKADEEYMTQVNLMATSGLVFPNVLL